MSHGSSHTSLPPWVPPLDTGQPSTGDINDLSDIPRTNYAARNSVIPITYGRDRFFGKPFIVTINETTGDLIVAYAFGKGEFSGYEGIIVDGNNILSAGTGYYGLKNGGFQTGDEDGWIQLEGGTIVADQGRSGTTDYALRMPSLAGGPSALSERLPIPYPDATIRVKGWCRRDSASIPDAAATLSIRTATTGGGALTYVPPGSFTGTLTQASVDNDWHYLEGYYTLPSDVVEYVINVGESAGTTGHWYFDDITFDFCKPNGAELDTPLMQFNLYSGSQVQGADALLAATLPGTIHAHLGLAYIVGRFPPKSTSGFPRVEAIVNGRKVFDPRKYNLLYDGDDDHMFVTAAETVAADAKWWFDEGQVQALGVSGWTSETSDPSPAGATYAQLNDNDDTSENMMSQLMDVDTTKNYTVTVYAKQPSGDRRNYLLVHFEDAAGNRINNSSSPVSDATGWAAIGTYHYWAINNATFAGTWTKYTFTFGPNAGATGTIPTGAVKMGIGGLFCRDGAVGTATTVRIADYRVFEGNTEILESDSTTYQYTTNPALCFRDLIKNFTAWDIWDHGVAQLANYNEEEIAVGVPRRSIGLTMTKPDTVEKWAKVWRTYMGGFLGWEDGRLRVVPNRAETDRQGGISIQNTTSSWIDMGDQPELDVGTGSFTLEAEFRCSTTTTDFIIAGKKANTVLDAGYWIQVSHPAGHLSARIGDGTNEAVFTTSGTDYRDDQWHKVSLVVDQTGNQMWLVIDGVAGTPVSIAGVTLTLDNTTPFRIGAKGTAASAGGIGVIDEVRLWNDVRTPAEIAAASNELSEDEIVDTSLLGYWKLNELSSETTAVDSSLNANNGTVASNAVFTNGNAQIIPAGVAMHITADDIIKDSLRLRRRSLRSTPNSVAIDYRDSSGSRWIVERAQSDSPRLSAGDEMRRMSRISLPGIHNATQAKREATERLNWFLTDLDVTFSMFDEGWKLQHGSIIAITHPVGLDAKLFRVVRMTGRSGRWTIDAVEYDPAVYSSEVVADPTIPDTNLGNPLNPPLPQNLNAVEELFKYKNGIVGARIRATWDNVVYPFFSQYLVEGYVGGVKVWETTTQSTEVVTPPVEELVLDTEAPVDYTIQVYTQSPFATGDFASFLVNVLGKFAVPGDVPSLSLVQTAADTVELNWGAATDIDIWRYEIRRGSITDTWETATQITQTLLIDGLSTVRTGIPVGTYRFFVKARDSVGNESTNAKFADITLAVPQPATGLTGFEVASEVRLAWVAPTSGFTERYRIAYDTIPTGNEITLDIVDTLRFQTKDVPEGTWRFLVYARDKNGVEAATPATIDIEVTSDAEAFLADTYNFVQATTATPTIVADGNISGFHQYFLRLDERLLYVTNFGDAFLSVPSDFSTYSAEPLANYHSSGTATWLSETKDFGQALTGTWRVNQDIVALKGNFLVELELSTDNITYDTYVGTAKGSFRYARVRITTTTTNTALIRSPILNVNVNVVPIEESGAAFSSATAPKTVNLTREYTAVKEVNAQPKNSVSAGGESTMAVVDNIIVGGNTGIRNTTTSYLAGGDYADLEFAGSATIEFWMKHSGGSQGVVTIMEKRNGAAAGWTINFAESTENVSITIDDGVDEVQLSMTDACPNDGNFHHIAFVIDRGSNVLRGYADGVVDAQTPSIALVGTLASGATNFNIFASSAGGTIWQNGFIDEVRIWNVVRSTADIQNNRQNELDMTQTQTGLIHYWQFNDTVGASLTTEADRTAGVTANLTAGGTGGLTYIDVGEDANNTIARINSFDVYCFDIFGQQLLEEFQWNWKGV